jgi:multicomponent Na+:H+ antiporter subunit D
MTLALAVLVPLAGAIATFAAPRAVVAAAGIAFAALTAGAGLAAVAVVAAEGSQEVALGGWAPPLGIALRADGFSAVMLAMTAAIGVAVSAYAARSFPARGPGWQPASAFWPLWFLLWAALNAVFLAGDAFNVYVALELVTLPAVALVTIERDRDALDGAMRYLLAALLGSMAYLLGVALLYGQTGTLDLGGIAAGVEPGLASAVAIAAVTVGLMVKAALFPLHFWLPRAHSSAPAPVSAVLSGLVVTAAAYLVLRLWLFVLAPALTTAATESVAALGAAAIVWGSVQALRAERLKLLIAYSTVAQIGYLFVVVALVWGTGDAPGVGGVEAGDAAWQGGVYHAVAHALAKAALFLAAGNVIWSIGTDRISGLGGLSARLPLSVATIALAGHSLAGLPPSGGFTAKWLILVAALEGGAWWWALVVAAGGLLTIGYVVRAVLPSFGRERTDDASLPGRRRKVPRTMEVTALALALAAIALGIRGEELISLLEVGA